MKNKLIAIIFLACMFVPISLTLVGLKLNRYLITEKIKKIKEEGSEEEQLEVLIFSLSQLKENLEWEHDYEFVYKNHYYDVAKIEEKNGLYYLWCHKDEKETNLVGLLHELVKNLNSKQKGSKVIFKRVLSQYFFNFKVRLLQDLKIGKLSRLLFQGSSFTPFSLIYPPPSPPPELA
ncbi:MAG: hypothetical protein H6579_09230 [Chitinophagales bacterium]|nr:hypothetical protein [Chitinophagales bacterium]